MWRLTYKWAKFRHPHKAKRWIIARYFGAFNRSRRDRWVFGDRETGAYLLKFAWTKIVRHVLVKGGASPDDPALAGYWAIGGVVADPRLPGLDLRLLLRQRGRCPSAVDYCFTPIANHNHPPSGNSGSRHPARQSAARPITTERRPAARTNTPRSHAHCRGGSTPTPAVVQHLWKPDSPWGLLEPAAWKAGTAGS